MAETIDNLVLRRRYAELLRQFMSGRMTNDEYDDRACAIVWSQTPTSDPSTRRLYRIVWSMYCDIRTHRMTDPGWRPPAEVRRGIAKLVVFLRSGSPIGQPRNIVVPLPEKPVANRVGAFIAGSVFAAIGLLLVTTSALILSPLFLFPSYVWLRFALATEARATEFSEAFDPSAIWPFASQADYDHALRSAGYLGRSASVLSKPI